MYDRITFTNKKSYMRGERLQYIGALLSIVGTVMFAIGKTAQDECSVSYNDCNNSGFAEKVHEGVKKFT